MGTSLASPSSQNPRSSGLTLCALAGVLAMVAATGLLWISPWAFAAIACIGAFVIAIANPFYGLLTLCAILPFDIYLGSLFVSELVLVSIFLGLCFHMHWSGRRWQSDSLIFLLILYWICTASTVFVAVDKGAVLKAAMKLALMIGAAFYSDQITWDERKLRQFLILLALATSLPALYGIFESMTGTSETALDKLLHIVPTESALGAEQILRAHSTFRYVLEFGMYLAIQFSILAPVFVLGASRRIKPAVRWILGTVASIELLALILSFARSSWLGVAAGVLFLLVGMLRRQKKLAVRLLVILAFAAVVAAPFAINKAESVSDFSGDLLRLSLWVRGSEVIAAHPLLGVGPNNLRYHMPMISLWGEDLPVGTLENLYLTVAAETGLLSLLILCAVFWGAIRRAFQAIPKAHSSLLATVESGVGVALIAAMACGLTDPVLTSTQNGLLLFLLLGVQRSIHRNNCVSPGTLSSSQVREPA